jgi:coatomer protein complex subunit epsilon
MSYNQIDDLRTARNAFYLGQYQTCITEVGNLPPTVPFTDVFRHRALAELNPAALDAAVTTTSPMALQSIKLYVMYKIHRGTPQHRQTVLDTLAAWLKDPDFAADITLQITAANIYFLDGNYKEALQIASTNANDNLEKYVSTASRHVVMLHHILSFVSHILLVSFPPVCRLALQVQILLAMNRPDLAEKAARTMADLDDDDALAQLASAWVLLAKHTPAALNEAFNTLTEVTEKYGLSAPVLSLLAVSLLLQHKARDAFQHLRQARELARAAGQPASVETLVNSAVCMFHRGSATPAADDVLAKVLGELRAAHPQSEFLQREAALAEQFDRCAAQYS